MNKTLSLILSFVLAISVLMYYQQAEAIHSFGMIVQPRQVNKSATYRFIFTIEKTLKVHEWIKLGFPQGTVIDPPIPQEDGPRRARLTQIIESMSIGLSPCSSCQGLPDITYYPDGTMRDLTFKSHIELNPELEGYSEIVVTVPDTCGFKTPAKEGFYQYRISTQAESTVQQVDFEIVESQIGAPSGIPQVVVDPPVIASEANITIAFNVGRGGWLRGGRDSIRLRFPQGFRFTKSFAQAALTDVLVNGRPLGQRPHGSESIMHFVVPRDIDNSERVTIQILSGVGIETPAIAGDYHIEVATTADGWAKSENFSLTGALDYARLTIRPNTIGRKADYELLFLTQDPILENELIKIHLPEEIGLPDENLEAQINGRQVVFEIVDHSLHLTNMIAIEREEAVEVLIKGLINPAQVQIVSLRLTLPPQHDLISTSTEIVKQKLAISRITIYDPNAFEVSQYLIDILFNDDNYPKEGDILEINLGFDENIHSKPISDLEGIEHFSVLLTHITNPEPGDYTLSISILGETVSHAFTILPPIPKSQIKIEGGERGNEPWWVSPPIISFEITDPTASLFLWWDDDQDHLIEYDVPRPADPGQYKARIWYYAQTSYGKEVPRMEEIWVDTLPPGVEVLNPTSIRTETHQPEYHISARLTRSQTILYGTELLLYDEVARINGVDVEVNLEDGSFGKTVMLEEGQNIVLIEAEDEAGNLWTREYTLILDTQAPQITIISPQSMATIANRTRKVMIIGSLDKRAELLIDGMIAYLDADGNFEHEYTAHAGLNEVELLATDRVGNVSSKTLVFYFGYTIQLQIGNKQAIVNEEPREMLLAPFIEAGRTLVPFRFIGESLGAAIDFTLHPQTRLVDTVSYALENDTIILTIGSKTAQVNGQPVPLDVAPKIIQGTTVVPLRFIAENLGCKVEWEATEQIITIIYPE